MKALRGGLVATIMAGALVALPTTNPRLTRAVHRGPIDPKTIYTRADKEFFLAADEFTYVRPGFHITVNSITIPPDDRRPVADLSFTDDLDQPLDRNGKVTPGSLSISLILAWWDAGTRYYTAYTTRHVKSNINGSETDQAGTDAGGTWTDIEVGHSVYKFKTALPEGFDQTKTHSLAIYASRNTTDIVGKNYYDNVVFDFRPDGQPVTEFWDKTVNGNCNECHNPLAAHGGSRQDVKLCVTCHNPQTIDPDTGHTVNFREMVHKIHRGSSLPSVQAGTPYVIIGHSDIPADFSNVVFPKDIRNCTTCHKKGATPEEGGTQFANYFTYPARTPCGACHDNINWVTGENHAGGPQADDSQCATCHRPQGDHEWDLSVLGAHTVPNKSTQLKGLNAQIDSVSNTAPGQNPTIVFALTENDGTPVAPSSFTTSSGGSNLNVLMGGPTADYAVDPFRERADHATFDGAKATYTFTHPIPADATGTWAFSLEARRDVAVQYPPPDGPTIREGPMNPVAYASVTGGEAEPRRMVVDIANCNVCHDHLALHGGQRFNTEECVMCHNPNASDTSQRPADAGNPESIDFKRMIHRIHTGESLTTSADCKETPNAQGCFTIYGFNGSVNTFNDVRFPGDRRECAKCHTGDSQQISETPPAGLLPTNTQRDWFAPQQHYTAACLGCHDSQAAAAHAFVMTAPFGEACATCHGPDAEFSVDKMHAQ